MIADASQPFIMKNGGFWGKYAAAWIGILPMGLTTINAIDWTDRSAIITSDFAGEVHR